MDPLDNHQVILRDAVRTWADKRFRPADVHRTVESGRRHDPEAWQELARMGLPGLLIAEQDGGAGYFPMELGLVFAEFGRTLASTPLLATVLAGRAISVHGTATDRITYLPRIAAGSTIAALAHLDEPGDSRPAATAVPTAGAFTLHGSKAFVVDGVVADLFVVTALTDDGPSLFTVWADSAGVSRERLDGLDLTRTLATVTFDHVPATLVGKAGTAPSAISPVLDLAAALLAKEQVGGARACLDMAVRYAQDRVQFGRPIGAFQAVKHKCAEMLVAVESAAAAAQHALQCHAAGAPDVSAASSLAKAFCSDAFAQVAADNIQIHGGIGFTWEHPAHLYLRRAKSSRLLFGTPMAHRAKLAELLGV